MVNRLKMATIDAILMLHAQGWSQRAITRRLGMHRETLSRHVRLANGDSKLVNMLAEELPPDASLALERQSYCNRFREVLKPRRTAGLAQCRSTSRRSLK
jgi:IS30 family transposase